MEWHIYEKDLKIVMDRTNRIACYCDNYLIAAQIVRDHNAMQQHIANAIQISEVDRILDEDQKQAIRDERRGI